LRLIVLSSDSVKDISHETTEASSFFSVVLTFSVGGVSLSVDLLADSDLSLHVLLDSSVQESVTIFGVSIVFLAIIIVVVSLIIVVSASDRVDDVSNYISNEAKDTSLVLLSLTLLTLIAVALSQHHSARRHNRRGLN
jgi:hypothetical protein